MIFRETISFTRLSKRKFVRPSWEQKRIIAIYIYKCKGKTFCWKNPRGNSYLSDKKWKSISSISLCQGAALSHKGGQGDPAQDVLSPGSKTRAGFRWSCWVEGWVDVLTEAAQSTLDPLSVWGVCWGFSLGRGLGRCPHWSCSEHLGPSGCFGNLLGYFPLELQSCSRPEEGSWRSSRTVSPWGEWQLGGLFPLHAAACRALSAVWMRATGHQETLFFALVWLSGLSGIINISTAGFGVVAKKQRNQKLCLLFLSNLKCFS